MTEIAYPTVYAAVVTLATNALTTLRVVDGYDTSQDEGDVLVLGVPNIFDTQSINAGTFSQTMNTFGVTAGRQESGTINGVLLAWVGDTDDTSAAVARAKAFGYLGMLAQALRSTPRLGIAVGSSPQDVVAQLGSGSPLEDKVGGATCVIPFTVDYLALL